MWWHLGLQPRLSPRLTRQNGKDGAAEKATRAGDTDDFEEPLGLQLPLQLPNLSSLAKEWFTFVMPTSSLIDFSNHCTR